jgi:hypothetical protein
MTILRSKAVCAAMAGLLLSVTGMALAQGGGQRNGTSSGQYGASAQSPTGQSPSSQTSQPVMPGLGSLGPDEPTRGVRTEEEMEKLRNSERQKRLIEDTEKLLTLANELKTDVDKSSKDTLSLDVVRKADEIEKLAHSVKEKMKGT